MCGGHLKATGAVQKIFSHSRYGDANYENKEDCDWIIEAPSGQNVHLSFLSFEMEDEQGIFKKKTYEKYFCLFDTLF